MIEKLDEDKLPHGSSTNKILIKKINELVDHVNEEAEKVRRLEGL